MRRAADSGPLQRVQVPATVPTESHKCPQTGDELPQTGDVPCGQVPWDFSHGDHNIRMLCIISCPFQETPPRPGHGLVRAEHGTSPETL